MALKLFDGLEFGVEKEKIGCRNLLFFAPRLFDGQDREIYRTPRSTAILPQTLRSWFSKRIHENGVSRSHGGLV